MPLWYTELQSAAARSSNLIGYVDESDINQLRLLPFLGGTLLDVMSVDGSGELYAKKKSAFRLVLQSAFGRWCALVMALDSDH